MSDLFAKAQANVDRFLIESLFGPGEWKGHDFHCTNPLRADSRPGSFSIKNDGRWYDFATDEGGDFVDLYARFKGLTLVEAARILANEPAPEYQEKKQSVPPQTHPNSEEYERKVRGIASAKTVYKNGRPSVAKEYGSPVLLSHYYNAAGQAMFSVARYEKKREDGGTDKTTRPYYFGTDGKIHTGCPWESGRPLLYLDMILAKTDLPVLIVEGEKCAYQARRALSNYIVTTWSGGAQAVDKTDWAPLSGRNVLIWPDNDSAGINAAKKIQAHLPESTLVNIPEGLPRGWDIADAITSGIDPLEIITGKTKHIPESPPQIKKGAPSDTPYIPLGHNNNTYYFLSTAKKSIISIPFGKFTRSIVLELATAEQWRLMGGWMPADAENPEIGLSSKYTTKNGTVRVDHIQDKVSQECIRVGIFDPVNIRGVGAWKDESGEIIVYDGEMLRNKNGQKIDQNKSGKYHYVSTSSHFENYFDTPATKEDGQELVDLLSCLPFARNTEAVLATGWALISNYAGCLPWRPHIWITGPSGTGKSTIILNRLIQPLIGDLHFTGSAETSKAATRRILKNDCRPAIFDEFEPKNKRRLESMLQILELAKNASSDTDVNKSSIVDNDGSVTTYYTRSCFCFSSINMIGEDQAISSRITPIEIIPMSQQTKIKNKDRLLSLDKLLENKAASYRRRIFQNITYILEDIQFLKNELRESVGNDRRIDQLSPMLAAFYALTHDEIGDMKRDPIELMSFVRRHLDAIVDNEYEQVNDEDTVIEQILSHIPTDITKDSIAVLIADATEDNPQDVQGYRNRADLLLQKLGIRLIFPESSYSPTEILINTKSPILTSIFKDTIYERYDMQLKRNPLCITQNRARSARIAKQRTWCRSFNFEKFKKRYLGDDEDEDNPHNNTSAA